ncbi:ORC-CDC6 family AAA ATPase [Massilia violaceinigra]|uniref:ORC-CDC6 family AAA ATPase n=1 Tax=Massilia violaceinigra TaxID=2045208 RepID=UPI0012FD6F45|nr:hypothetical protein [Massilia violaceinigra]
MNFSINPFAESTIAEHIQSEEFVQIFSPAIINSAQELFRPGNVILRGAPGSGKSMLLTLLKPETQAAYADSGQDFPIPARVATYLGAGINLARAGAQDIGTRLSRNATAQDKQRLAGIFGDFINYYVTRDLLRSVQTVVEKGEPKLNAMTGVQPGASANLDQVAINLAKDPCWGGYLPIPSSFDNLLHLLEDRLKIYRSYFNFATDLLPEAVSNSITSIGEPIAVAAQCLRQCGVIGDATSVFIRIDQLEELYYLEKKFDLGVMFRQVVNKALAMRDPRVSYRIGVRGFAWEEQLTVYGSAARLEQGRDFSVVDLDVIFKRSENSKTWIFKSLAADVFKRRLIAAHLDVGKDDAANIMKAVLGKGISHDMLSQLYAGKAPDKTLDLDEQWPQPWKSFLEDLVKRSPLEAKFAEAWSRQRGKGDVVRMGFDPGSPPWGKYYWRKERNDQALMQIAAKSKARLVWSGVEDVIGLSGGNTLCFITVCKFIWQAWLRTPQASRYPNGKLPQIEPSVQATGIFDASRTWFENVISQGHNGDTRRRLIQMLGIWFSKEMGGDRAMSNPGHNGFSLTTDDIESDQEIRRVLAFAVDFGDLFEGPHTTKLADKKPRRKWYLSPILCPYFRIPHIRTKEPIYTNVSDLRRRIEAAEVLIGNGSGYKSQQAPVEVAQLNLFDKE